MPNELKLVETKQLGDIAFQCYQESNGSDEVDGTVSQEFWATRIQIRQLLEYEYPREAIGKIHERNKERLDRFSAVVNLTTPSGVQSTTVYSFKGLLEICRYSQQPVANVVIDVLWEIADEIHKNGAYLSKKRYEKLELDQQAVSLKLKQLEAEKTQLQEASRQLESDNARLKREQARLVARINKLEAPQEFETPPDLIDSEGHPVYSLTLKQLADVLSNIGKREIKCHIMSAWLRKTGWLFSDEVFWDKPTDKSYAYGLFIVVPAEHTDPNTGATVTYEQTRATPRAVQFFGNMVTRGERLDSNNPMNILTEKLIATINVDSGE